MTHKDFIESKMREFDELRREHSFQTMPWAESFLRSFGRELLERTAISFQDIQDEDPDANFKGGYNQAVAEHLSDIDALKEALRE